MLTNKIKTYLVASVLDDRKADAHWFHRRIPVIGYLVEEGASLLQRFDATCLADIAHPDFAPQLTEPDLDAITRKSWPFMPRGMVSGISAVGKARHAIGSATEKS